ncbi:potassium channel family protein [Allosediminivita pacifica]|uniref:Trk system potassium uptake protein TrkA n=1 Tax=Allosediminivita pacifica TaxID=1267769 RepID=A0A2T6AR38_9RHOB|nr:TrkA family potassium uptake protein [Allosediminivita pacifica]PTX46272.1 trk system potassium uptake protein TrkA [Allosediminivita pacifica]GGB17785.1 potassium transporter [Allosediminivita pacifica]
MRIVIIGASRFGTATATRLSENGHEVVMVDHDAERLDALTEELDCGMIHGDGTLPSVQRDAFGDHADALVALTNQDDVNILAAAVGRSVGFERVVPQIVRPELLAVCEELGLKDLITPHATVARSLVDVIEDHNDATLDLRLHKGLQVMGYQIGKQRAGKRVCDLDMPRDSKVIAVTRGEDESLVFEDTELQEGDLLMIVAARGVKSELDSLFDTD